MAVLAKGEPVAGTQKDVEILDEVLCSKAFARSTSLQALLRYLAAHRDVEISEYAIAIEALGRPSDFESKIDATVRVQIGRLRRALERFYAEEAPHRSRRITIPVGSHKFSFIDLPEIIGREPDEAVLGRNPAASMQNADVLQNAAAVRPLIATHLGYSFLALLTILLFILAGRSFYLARLDNESHRQPPPFWQKFLDNGMPIRIVLPAPIFFSVEMPHGGSVMMRDILVNDPGKWTDSPAFLDVLKTSQMTPPKVWQGYTVVTDTFASLQLARFLDTYGVRTNFSSSADLPDEIVDHENVVAFGTKNSLAAYQSELSRLSFRMANFETKVTDLLSPPDHPQEFRQAYESGSRQITPGIIALIPREKGEGRLLLIQGAETSALVSYLTSDEGMREISQATTRMHTPYFEAVILSEVNGNRSLQSRLAAVRAFDDSRTALNRSVNDSNK